MAIGLFLTRITQKKIHLLLVRIMMAATMVVGTIYFFVVLFQCSPISYYWDFDPNAKGHCMSPEILVIVSYVASVLNALSDIAFGSFPYFIVKDLNMRRSTKVAVIAILGFGALGSLSTLVRLAPPIC
jgi:tetrahydromethanopterin S-methyltransferase subunit D